MRDTVSDVACLPAQRTGKPLPPHKFFGKPNAEPYRLAETALAEQAQQLGLLKGPQPSRGVLLLLLRLLTSSCRAAGRLMHCLLQAGHPLEPSLL